MPQHVSDARGRAILLAVYRSTLRHLMADSNFNRAILRHAMEHEDPKPYMYGRRPGGKGFVGYADIKKFARSTAPEKFRPYSFRFTKTGTRKRKRK